MITLEKKHINISIATAVTIIIFLVSMAMNIATWKAEMQAEHKEFDDRIAHLGDKVVDMRTEISVLDDKADKRDLQIVEIQTKLTNIEALLIEIKLDLKTHAN
jgi:hypothetical protein